MPKKEKRTIEILPASQAGLVPQLNLEATLARMVRDSVAEIMVQQDASGMRPDFQARNIAVEVQRRQTVFERRKWSFYYERWGCKRCDTKKRIHATNGYCHQCQCLIYQRLAQIKREYAKEHRQENMSEHIQEIVSRVESAERLLGKRWARKMKAAVYARVSTANNGQDPRVQTRELGEFCERRGWTAVEYVDIGISGTKEKRPALDRLMADAHKRRFDVVVVWRFDRFARSVSHLLRALETFQSLGIEFVSLSEQMDTSTPTGKMVFTVLGAVAELERSLIVERVKAGLRNARAKGQRLGRPAKDLDHRRIAGLRAQGLAWRAIANQLGVGLATLHRAAGGRSKIQETDLGTR